MLYVDIVCFFLTIWVSGARGAQLLLSSDHVVLLLNTDTKESDSLTVDGARTPHSLDYHHSRGYLYYAAHDDLGKRSFIKRRSIPFIKNEKAMDINSMGIVNELCVDWVQDHIYWVNKEQAEVQMANLDGSNARVVISRQSLRKAIPSLSDQVKLYDLHVDPHLRALIMVADETNASYSSSFVVTSDTNGQNLTKAHTDPLPTLPKIAVDVGNQRLYVYGTQDKDLIVYSYHTGMLTNPKHSPVSKRLSDRFHILGESLYWVDPLIGPENIYLVDLSVSNGTFDVLNQHLLYASKLSYIHDFKVVERLIQGAAGGCEAKRCSHDCVMQGSATCVCPHCLTLGLDGRTCQVVTGCQGDLTGVVTEGNNTTATSTSVRGCKLPAFRQNVYTSYTCPSCTLKPGDTVPDSQLVVVSCTSGHQLVQGPHYIADKAYIACQRGLWEPNIPQCYKLCPPLTSLTLDLECWQGADIVRCDQPMLPNTTVRFLCKEYHEASYTNQPNVIRCDQDGVWTRDLPRCTPKCGQSNLNSFQLKPAIVGGQASQRGDFPWHAGIFHNKSARWEAACGGTLISSRVVLTAAHCVTLPCAICKSPIMAIEDVMVALGKRFRDWYTEEESETKRAVKQIEVHPNYVGSSLNYGQDIAVLILESEVAVNGFVMPACVDFLKTHVTAITTGDQGYVAGWGNTEACKSVCASSSQSDTLMYSRASIVDFNTCFATTQAIKRFPASRLTPDKYCASNGSEAVVQQGDSGGGLTFVFGGIHFVYGIVSVKLQLELQDKEYYSFGAFTSVPAYIDWLNTKLY